MHQYPGHRRPIRIVLVLRPHCTLYRLLARRVAENVKLRLTRICSVLAWESDIALLPGNDGARCTRGHDLTHGLPRVVMRHP